MDYPTPRAGDLPSFDISFIETPAPDNPFLVEGGSERDDRRAAANRHCGYRCFMAPPRPRYLACHHCGNGAPRAISGAKAQMTHQGNAQRRASFQ
jgi:hypothetical protein